MKVYDDKLYEFLSKKENFEPYLDLYQHYDKMRIRIVNEFWDLVLQNINANPPRNSDWKAEVEPPFTGNRKLRMHHPATSNLPLEYRAGIIYEHLENHVYLGVWFNRSQLHDDEHTKSICSEAAKLLEDKNGWKVGSGGWWFVIYRDTGKDFRQKDTLMQILPEERKPIAETMASDIVETVNLFGDFCVEQVKKYPWK